MGKYLYPNDPPKNYEEKYGMDAEERKKAYISLVLMATIIILLFLLIGMGGIPFLISLW